MENVGYVIPTPVVHHFLSDYLTNCHFTGFPALGIQWQRMENEALRKAYRMAPGQKGVACKARLWNQGGRAMVCAQYCNKEWHRALVLSYSTTKTQNVGLAAVTDNCRAGPTCCIHVTELEFDTTTWRLDGCALFLQLVCCGSMGPSFQRGSFCWVGDWHGFPYPLAAHAIVTWLACCKNTYLPPCKQLLHRQAYRWWWRLWLHIRGWHLHLLR